MESFWMMMKQLESDAYDSLSPLDILFVEGYFRQWNEIMKDNAKPSWVIFAEKEGKTSEDFYRKSAMQNEDVNDIAYDAGYKAASKNKLRAPAQCLTMNFLITNKSGNTIDMLDSWLKGYDRRTDEEVAKLFPDDKFFQDKLKAE